MGVLPPAKAANKTRPETNERIGVMGGATNETTAATHGNREAARASRSAALWRFEF
jgi:hypothetical protein